MRSPAPTVPSSATGPTWQRERAPSKSRLTISSCAHAQPPNGIGPAKRSPLQDKRCGKPSRSIRQTRLALVTKANALNPDAAAGWYHSTIYTADYLNGNYRHALEVTRQNPQSDTF